MSAVRPDVEAPHPLEKDFAFRNNVAQAHVSIRLGFLRKVYGLLFTQLALTAICAGTMFYLRETLLQIPAFSGFSLLSLILALGILVVLTFKKHETPLNYILLFAFTLLESIGVGSIVLHFSPSIVLQAVALTALATFCLMSYTFQTKRDFSQWGSGLFVALLLLLIAGPINLFLGSSMLEFSIAIGGAVLFSLLIIYDTHRIMHHCSPEEYIVACIELYLDILNLFVYLLRILKDIQGNN